MSMGFKALPAVAAADADDPNTTAPDAGRVFEVGRNAQNDDISEGIGFFLDFDGGASPVADIEVWIKDAASNVWALVTTIATLGDKAYQTVLNIAPAEVHLRFAALTLNGATDCTPKVVTI